MYLLGYDSGTSSIKATLLDAQTNRAVASASYPPKEMAIISKRPGWAEQNPQDWWDNLKQVTGMVLQKSGVAAADVKAIGITYQMHGLVCVGKNGDVLRPSIIWCDGRAVEYGDKAADAIGRKKCLEVMLNTPGNFTAAKLAWVKQNEPDVFKQIHKIMLPGDYLAMKMTDRTVTTPSGLSEGIFWDFRNGRLANEVMDAFGFSRELIPEIVDTFCVQGELASAAAKELGLAAGTPVAYRAGDQPNNAFSLNVLQPGELAATAGTSGVVYGIADAPCYDEQSRVNTFVHVNNSAAAPRYGSLLCINGCGILNSWLKHNFAGVEDYPQMNTAASTSPIGSEGLSILPYGNGAERTLGNRNVAAHIMGLNFNIHTKAHVLRAAQEGIVFAFHYALAVMRDMGIDIKTVRAGKANMFQSPIFTNAFATLTDSCVELYDTDGSQGAARGAGYGAGIYKSFAEAFKGLDKLETITPSPADKQQYDAAYDLWKNRLAVVLK